MKIPPKHGPPRPLFTYTEETRGAFGWKSFIGLNALVNSSKVKTD